MMIVFYPYYKLIKISGWKDDLPAPGDVVLEASSMDIATRAVNFRNRKQMAEKAERDWVGIFLIEFVYTFKESIQDKRTEERQAYLANRNSLLESGVRFGSTLRRIVHKKNRLEKDINDDHPKLNVIVIFLNICSTGKMKTCLF